MESPDLSSEYPLTKSQVNAFETNGHIFPEKLYSQSEVSFCRSAIPDSVKKLNTEKRKLEDRDTHGKAFLQIFNLLRQNEVLKAFVLSKRFAHVTAKQMGVDKVRLYMTTHCLRNQEAAQLRGTRTNITGRWILIILLRCVCHW